MPSNLLLKGGVKLFWLFKLPDRFEDWTKFPFSFDSFGSVLGKTLSTVDFVSFSRGCGFELDKYVPFKTLLVWTGVGCTLLGDVWVFLILDLDE